jgi:hypothetical protein
VLTRVLIEAAVRQVVCLLLVIDQSSRQIWMWGAAIARLGMWGDALPHAAECGHGEHPAKLLSSES